jgi:hypothetical protein
MARRRPKLLTASEAIGFLPKEPEVKSKRLDELITDMSLRAAAEAEKAWEKVVKDGHLGTLALPRMAGPAAVELARRWFLAAYGTALLDHTIEAVKRLKAAAELDAEDEMKRLAS